MALVFTLAIVFVLASCGGDEGCKNHTYSTEYTTDAYGHWYVSTCGCEGEVANYGAHKDEDKNGKCDVCEYVICAHTFANEWSSDENGHYYASTCECAPQKSNESAHVDENKDGVCDVCKYVVCSHEYATEWSSDETNHWKAPVCGCEIDSKSFGAHVDSNKDGNCDTCAYVVCAHTYESEWSSDGAYHWYEATCGCDVVKDKKEHEAGEDETVCGTCGANICKHTYEDTLSYDDTYHWYASSCGCDVVKDKAEHTWSSAWEKDGTGHWHKTECGCDVISSVEEHFDSDDEDSRCDKCGQIDFASLIGNIDEYVGEERNQIDSKVDEKDPIYDNKISTSQSIKIYDDYILVLDGFGNKKYISYCGENNSIPFVVNVDSGNLAQRELDYDDSSLLSFYGVCEIAAGTSLEEYLISLYNLGVSENASSFNYLCDEENSKYSFSYFYDAGYVYADVVVEFTLDEERMGVTSLTLDEKRYDHDTYVMGETNVVTYTVKQTITQGFGDPMDSTDAKNPYAASKYLFSELILFIAEKKFDGTYAPTSEQITEGCTVIIAPEYANGLRLMLGTNQAHYAEFNRYTVESNGLEAGWTNYPIFMYATKGGTYEVTVSNELTSISFTVVAEYKAPTTLRPAVVVDDEKVRVKEYSIYSGLEFVVGVLANSAAESPFVNMPTVSKGDASKITFTKDGENWIAVASEAGEYELTFVSALDESITATLPLTVLEIPTAADILNGYYELSENDMSMIGSIKFTPVEAGASSGTAVLKITIPGNPMLGMPDEVWEATVSYAYENGGIVLSGTEGDDVSQFALKISDRYVLTLVRTPYPEMPDYIEEYEFFATEEIIIKDPTENPFTMNVVETYQYHESNAFIFVAGEAGKYVFNVPAGYGLKVNSSEKVHYLNNVSGFEFSLDLKERQEVTFIPMAAKVGEVTMYFHIEKETVLTDANGLGGTYTFVALSQFELTFTPSASGATSGVLTVKDPININRSGSFSYTIVDGDYVFSEDAGVFITKDVIGSWSFQNASLSKPYQFSGPTSYVEPTVQEIPYNGYKDENKLGGIYTVTALGNEYKLIIVPSADGGDGNGMLQIYNPASGKYSEPYSYLEICNEYFFDDASVAIYRENDKWLIKAEGLNGVEFADATVEVKPQSNVLVIGSNTIKLTPVDIANGGKEFTITPSAKGEFTFDGDVDVYVRYGDNLVKVSGKIVVEKGVTYTVVITTNGPAGAYLLNVNFIQYTGGGMGELPDDEL